MVLLSLLLPVLGGCPHQKTDTAAPPPSSSQQAPSGTAAAFCGQVVSVVQVSGSGWERSTRLLLFDATAPDHRATPWDDRFVLWEGTAAVRKIEDAHNLLFDDYPNERIKARDVNVCIEGQHLGPTTAAASGKQVLQLGQVKRIVAKVERGSAKNSSWSVVDGGDACPDPDFWHRYITVAVEHGNPAGGTFRLYYELDSNYDKRKPTFMIPADAQQTTSWVGKADRMKKLLGTELNVVVFQHRGNFCSRIDNVATRTDADWARAYRIFRIDNVVEDMDRVRRDLLGPDGKMMLWGCSGVATTAIQYLKKYHRHVPRAVLGSFYLEPKGASLRTVEFFEDFLAKNQLEASWSKIVAEKRVDILQLLFLVQRHLYSDSKKATSLIQQTAKGNLARYHSEAEAAGQNVQYVIRAYQHSWPQTVVFMYESNVRTDKDPNKDLNYPVLAMGAPIERAARAGLVEPRRWDLSGLKAVSTEILLFGGTLDHAVPLSETRKIHRLLPSSRLAVFRAYHCLVDTGCKYARGVADLFFTRGVKSAESNLREGPCKDKLVGIESSGATASRQ